MTALDPRVRSAPSTGDPAGAGRRWSPARIGAGLALASWAGLFWFVLLTARVPLYLSPRTAWLVPIGAALASIAAVLRLASARTDRHERLTTRDVTGLGLIVLPVIVLLILPPATLGVYAVDRRGGFSSSGIGASARIVTGPIDLVDVAAAQSVDDAMADLRERAGERVVLEGFVSRNPGTPVDEFDLTRFVITCCVADATIAQVRVVGAPPADRANDTWVRVTGRVYPVGGEVLIAASRVEPIPRPANPYLTP
jgi:uncharacterized repeat protein (TIGR03943 family)